MISLLIILLQVFSLSDKQFEIQLKNYLDEKLSNYDSYVYEIVGLPKNYFRIELDYDREFRINKNYATVPVRLYDKRNNESLSILTLKVKLYKKVLVTIQEINRNDQLSNTHFELKEIDITNVRGKPISDLNFSEGYRAKTKIKSGSVLVEELIEQIPDVFYNDKIILHAGRNGVDISTEVVAKEEGKIGDVIRVITNDNKIFKAKIIDKYNVSLIE